MSEHVSRDLNLSPCVTPSLFPFLLFILGTEFFRSVKPYLSPIFVTWVIFVNSGQLVWNFLFWDIYYTKFQKRQFLFSRKIIFVERVSPKKEKIYISVNNHVIRVSHTSVRIAIVIIEIINITNIINIINVTNITNITYIRFSWSSKLNCVIITLPND